jgi:phage baseplate assembly protein W
MASGFSPVIPLQQNDEDGFYVLTKSMKQNIKQNIKNLFLTSPGERVMIVNFGVGVRNFLFENNSFELQSKIQSRIIEQIRLFMPFVKMDRIEFLESESEKLLLGIRFFYSVPQASFSDVFHFSETL